MSGVVSRTLTACALVLLLGEPAAPAFASWPSPVDGPVVLRFAETWHGPAGAPRSHGGLDLGAPGGSPVRACAGGTVTFAGRVPAADGGTVLAVTVLTADGLRVTLMPLASAEVSGGAVVEPGDPLGTLAGSGDGSVPEPHLHVSVRRGERQIDPASLLGLDLSPASDAGGDAVPRQIVPPAPTPSAATATGAARAGGPAAQAVASVPTLVAVAELPVVSADPVAAVAAALQAATARGARARELMVRPLPTRGVRGGSAWLPRVLRLTAPDPALALRLALAVCSGLALLRTLPRASAQGSGGTAARRA